jgi:uncharacterized protein YbcI
MEAPRETLEGGRLLVAISSELVTIFRDFVGKGPERCKTYWAGDDMLMVLLTGGFSVAEQTLFAAGRGAAVKEARMALQETLAERMKATVEALTGRKVIAFLSATHQEPDLSAELFVLEPQVTNDSRPPGGG